MKYLITGAAGHLGQTIVAELIKNGESVRALVLPRDAAAKALPEGVEIVYGDVLDMTSLERFFENAEDACVIHCAGIVTISSRFIKMVYDVNTRGTKNIVDLCEARHVKKLVYVSSVHAIPELPRGEIMREIADFKPEEVEGLYAKTKSEASAYVMEAAKRGLDASIVHPSGMCGPNDYGHGHLTELIIDYCRGKLPAGVIGGYDFVDVRDVAQAIIECSRSGGRGECYILSNRYVSVKELLNIFHEVTGKRPVRIFLPAWIAKLFAPMCEAYCRLRHMTPLYTAYSIDTLSANSSFSHAKADAALHYSVRPIRRTVEDTVAWLRGMKRI